MPHPSRVTPISRSPAPADLPDMLRAKGYKTVMLFFYIAIAPENTAPVTGDEERRPGRSIWRTGIPIAAQAVALSACRPQYVVGHEQVPHSYPAIDLCEVTWLGLFGQFAVLV